MVYRIKSKKLKEKTEKEVNPYFVDGKDVSQMPIYYLEDAEGNGLTEEQTKALWQYGIDTGVVWHLQGFYGRTAQALIDEGILHYPIKHTALSNHDYYGNPIPTHEEARKKGIYKRRKEEAEMRNKLQETFG